MIRHDKSRGSIVLTCSRCPGIRELVNTEAEANAWTIDHELRVHPVEDDSRRVVRASQARVRRATRR